MINFFNDESKSGVRVEAPDEDLRCNADQLRSLQLELDDARQIVPDFANSCHGELLSVDWLRHAEWVQNKPIKTPRFIFAEGVRVIFNENPPHPETRKELLGFIRTWRDMLNDPGPEDPEREVTQLFADQLRDVITEGMPFYQAPFAREDVPHAIAKDFPQTVIDAIRRTRRSMPNHPKVKAWDDSFIVWQQRRYDELVVVVQGEMTYILRKIKHHVIS
jgi:hypothetical protein